MDTWFTIFWINFVDNQFFYLSLTADSLEYGSWIPSFDLMQLSLHIIDYLAKFYAFFYIILEYLTYLFLFTSMEAFCFGLFFLQSRFIFFLFEWVIDKCFRLFSHRFNSFSERSSAPMLNCVFGIKGKIKIRTTC